MTVGYRPIVTLKDGRISDAASATFVSPLPTPEVVTRFFTFQEFPWNALATSSTVFMEFSDVGGRSGALRFTHSPMTSQFFVDATATVTSTLTTLTFTQTVSATTTSKTTIPQETTTSQCTTGTITNTVSTGTSTSTSTVTPTTKTVTTTKCKTITTTVSCVPRKRNGPRDTDSDVHRRQQDERPGEEPFCSPVDGTTPDPTFYTTGTTTVTIEIPATTTTETVTSTSTSMATETPDPATTTVCNNVDATSQVTATTTTTSTTTLKRKTTTRTYTVTATKTEFYGGKPRCCPTSHDKGKKKGGRG
ncbi:hypothetical protein BST61_g2953 [Cercospora zeina]